MRQSDGVAAHAAEALGVSRTTLYHALKRLGIDPATLRTK
jgi:transcriptional regulator of acetoin/glycerol metabolism